MFLNVHHKVLEAFLVSTKSGLFVLYIYRLAFRFKGEKKETQFNAEYSPSVGISSGRTKK